MNFGLGSKRGTMSEEIILPDAIPVFRNRQHKAAFTRFSSCWTPEQIEFVRQEWPKAGSTRLSAAEIALVVHKSRNAVIGKAHRLGLVRDTEPAPGTRIRGERVPIKQRLRTEGLFVAKARETAPVPVREDAPLTTKPPITIGELRYNTCRAVVGQGDDGLATYCGDMTFGTKAFCEGHCAMYYAPREQRKRQ